MQAAIDEFVQLGRTKFLARYGFGKSRDFLVRDPKTGTDCDSKAIAGRLWQAVPWARPADGRQLLGRRDDRGPSTDEPRVEADTVLQELNKIAAGDVMYIANLDPKVVQFLESEFTPAGLRDTLFEPEGWEGYVGLAIDFLFPTPAGKAAAVSKISGKVSKETLAALEAKYGPALVGGPKATTKLPVPSDLPTNIHIGQQGKHIRGNNNFIEGRSYFNDGVDPADLLAGVHSGKYSIVGTGARGNPIVECGRPIGVDGRTGQAVTRGQIHYGKNDAHIVPDARK